MSYFLIASMAKNQDLTARCKAAAASEVIYNSSSPAKEWMRLGGMDTPMWYLAASPGWAAAWSSALANEVESPGSDAGVITDAMILSAVQSVASA